MDATLKQHEPQSLVMPLGENPTLKAILDVIEDPSLTPRQQARKAETFSGTTVDWVLSFHDASERRTTGKEILSFKHPEKRLGSVFVRAESYPEIENTHRGTMLRIKGVISRVDRLGVVVDADEIIF